MSNIEAFAKYVEEYESWFDRYPWAYQSELTAVRSRLPLVGDGIEIGVGSGRFAAPLGIKVGIDPSTGMRALAQGRGIQVFNAKAEDLPFGDKTFDFGLMVTTVCFLDDALTAFGEARRILKPEGVMIVGLVDKNSALGMEYQRRKSRSRFYSSAKFYSPDEVIDIMTRSGFKQFDCVQTLFGDIHKMDRVDPLKEGKGDGSFVVIRAKK